MGYLQMQLMNETTETSTIGICLNIDKFYADLDFTANSDFEKWDEYPFERFHERMREILEEACGHASKMNYFMGVMTPPQ